MTALGLGMPDGYWSSKPQSTVLAGEALDRRPWIMERHPMPAFGTAERLGIAPGYALNMPSSETGVFSGSVYLDHITQERVIHLDQYTGEVRYDAGMNDLGALGWAAGWRISIHLEQARGEHFLQHPTFHHSGRWRPLQHTHPAPLAEP